MAPPKSLTQAPGHPAGNAYKCTYSMAPRHSPTSASWVVPRGQGWTEVAEELISVNNVRRALANFPAWLNLIG